jgi:uncharacterized coiled-coil protein SlyX
MMMNTKKTILVELIQNSLTGKLDPSTHFNPQFLADAIIEKLELEKTFEERNIKKINDAIDSFNNMIDEIDKDMDLELQSLGADEILLKNFIRGQKTTCEKLKESLKTL